MSPGLLLPMASTTQVAALALPASVLVEVGQLHRATGIESIRRTTRGGLALDHGFLRIAPACCAVGVRPGRARRVRLVPGGATA